MRVLLAITLSSDMLYINQQPKCVESASKRKVLLVFLHRDIPVTTIKQIRLASRSAHIISHLITIGLVD